jgi:hypothetical protein
MATRPIYSRQLSKQFYNRLRLFQKNGLLRSNQFE